MSSLGTRWSIGGVSAAFITRGSTNGCYHITFEREKASLEDIEAIDWAKPTVEHLGRSESDLGLPEGYGFELTDIRYQHAGRVYVAVVQTAAQYLGDVTGYQAQIEELEAAAAEQTAQLAEANAQLAELEAAYDDE